MGYHGEGPFSRPGRLLSSVRQRGRNVIQYIYKMTVLYLVQHIQYIVQRERGNSIVRARSFCGQSDAVSQRITAACLHMSSGLMAVLHCLWPLELERPIYT